MKPLVRNLARRIALLPLTPAQLLVLAGHDVILETMRRYLRVEVVGLEKIPRRGRVVLAPNHSGCTGFDAALLGYLVKRQLRRIPRILTLWKLFEAMPSLERTARRMGLVAASMTNGVRNLERGNLIMIFPEGEDGSFKPTSERYRLRLFRTGFVRMAILSGAPIVPVAIIGAEETNINLATLRWKRFQFPLPLNLLPLPAKWRILVLDPIDVSAYSREDAFNRDRMEFLARKIQKRVQSAIDRELKRRDYVYFKVA